MKLVLKCGDITLFEGDAIVNAANRSLLGGGGVDGAIHHAAGPGLLRECVKLNGCQPGEAKITKGYNLRAKYVVHTVGPVWKGGNCGEKQILQNCYRNSVLLAKQNNIQTVAFPLISAGAYGYPISEAIKVAIETLTEFTDNDILMVLMLYDVDTYNLATTIRKQLKVDCEV